MIQAIRIDNVLNKNTEHGSYVYGYDDVYRLTSSDNPSSSDESYTYDDVGNRLTSVSYTDWQYNNNNELLAYDGISYIYDNSGNIIQKTDGAEILNYIYDIDNRLIRVENETSSVIADYYYDPFGRRLWKEVDGQRTYFHYSDEGLVGEYDSTGTEIKTYGYKPNLNWTTDPLFMKQGTEYYFYQNDHLGTPKIMIDISGNIVWSAIYDSFGKAEVQPSSTIENNLRFPGQYYDSETGLHYNWYRYYEPEIGRYLRTDPIGFLGGDVNLYRYVGNNPVNWGDPWGLWKFSITFYTPFYGLGGGITIGENPDGLPFFTVRPGVGFGGGISYDPNGTSPGYDPCDNFEYYGGATVGAYADVGLVFRGIGLSLDAEGGYVFTPGAETDHPYFGISPNISLSSGWRFQAGGGVGFEIGGIN